MGCLEGKVAIVTGAGRGIGAAIARRYAEEGAAVVINDLGSSTDGVGGDLGPAQETADAITKAGGKAISDGGDIADVATGERLVSTAVNEFGRLDIVANVAGILRDRMIFNLSEEDWDAVIRVHLKGHYSTVRPAAQYFREQKNPDANYRIINFTSLSALEGSPSQPNYAAAKMGVIGLTYSLAQGLGRYGVTANAIAPSAATRLTPTSDGNSAADQFVADPRNAPENVAPLAVYLASDRSRWLTGRTMQAGGYGVALYNNPQIISELTSPEAWTNDALAAQLEDQFRPLADGPPPSLFAPQPAKG